MKKFTDVNWSTNDHNTRYEFNVMQPDGFGREIEVTFISFALKDNKPNICHYIMKINGTVASSDYYEILGYESFTPLMCGELITDWMEKKLNTINSLVYTSFEI